MSTPSTVFIVMRGDARTGEYMPSMKVFVTHEKASEYAMKLRKQNPEGTTYVVIQETELTH
jgi:hypothetical protein